MPLIPIPVGWLTLGTVVSSILFVSLPVFAIFFASKFGWTWRSALTSFILAIIMFVLITLLARQVSGPTFALSVFGALLQIGVLAWASSLGALIATGIRDKNLLLPICFVLAAVDIIAVFAPIGTVKLALESEKGRMAFETIAYKVPQFGSVTPAAQIGPADFLFLSMFFVAIHKFGMRSKETLIAIVPGLLIYLGIVLFLGDTTMLGVPLRALPALVPIGLLVLAVNWREFKMSREEKIMTTALLAVCVVAVWASFALTKKPPTGPQTGVTAPQSPPE